MKMLIPLALSLLTLAGCATEEVTPSCQSLTAGELAAIEAGIQAELDKSPEYAAFTAFRKKYQSAIAAIDLDVIGTGQYTWDGSKWVASGVSNSSSMYTFPDGVVLTIFGGGGLVSRIFTGDAFTYEISTSANGKSTMLGDDWGAGKESVAALGVVRDRERYWFPGGLWSDTDQGSGPSIFELTYTVAKFDVVASEEKESLHTETKLKVNGSSRCPSGLDPLRKAFPDVNQLLQLEL